MKNKVPKYSHSEQELLDLMPKRGKKITTTELANLRKKRPHIQFPNNIVNSIMRNLMEKVALRGEDFRICRTPQRGPYPIEYWIEKLY